MIPSATHIKGIISSFVTMTSLPRRSPRLAARVAPAPVPVELKNDAAQILRWFLKKQDALDWFVEEYERRALDAPNPGARAAAFAVANEYRMLAENGQRRLTALRAAYNATTLADYDIAMAEYDAADKFHKDHFVGVQRGIATWDEARQQPAPPTEPVALRRSPRKSMVRNGDL